MEAIDSRGAVVISHPGYSEGLIAEIRLMSILILSVAVIHVLIQTL